MKYQAKIFRVGYSFLLRIFDPDQNHHGHVLYHCATWEVHKYIYMCVSIFHLLCSLHWWGCQYTQIGSRGTHKDPFHHFVPFWKARSYYLQEGWSAIHAHTAEVKIRNNISWHLKTDSKKLSQGLNTQLTSIHYILWTRMLQTTVLNAFATRTFLSFSYTEHFMYIVRLASVKIFSKW